MEALFQTLSNITDNPIIDISKIQDNPKLADTISSCFKEFFSIDTLADFFKPDFVSEMELLVAFIVNLYEYNLQNNIPDEVLRDSVIYYKPVFNAIYEYEHANGTPKREILRLLNLEIEKGYQDHLYYLNTQLEKKSKKRILNKIFLFILIASLVFPSAAGFIAYQYKSEVLMAIAMGAGFLSQIGFMASILYFIITGSKKR